MAEKQNTQFSSVQDIFIPNIKIIGVGGAGGNVVTQMAEENLDQVKLSFATQISKHSSGTNLTKR